MPEQLTRGLVDQESGFNHRNREDIIKLIFTTLKEPGINHKPID
jgi:hypothetical protein